MVKSAFQVIAAQKRHIHIILDIFIFILVIVNFIINPLARRCGKTSAVNGLRLIPAQALHENLFY